MSDLKPYTVTNHCGVIFISLNGVEHGTVSAERAGVNLEALLNAAYVKGVQDERATWMETDYPSHNDLSVEAAQLRAANLLIAAYGFSLPIADRLVANGINCPAAFEGVEVEDLTGNCWFTRDEAEDIMSKVNPS